MDEKTLAGYQDHLGYDDRQFALWKSNPHNIKIAEALPEAEKYQIIAEVIKSSNCGAGHQVGDQLLFSGAGSYIGKKPKGPVCHGALVPLMPMVNTEVLNTVMAGRDPGNVVWDVIHCTDVGVENGGWGEILMKIRVERI